LTNLRQLRVPEQGQLTDSQGTADWKNSRPADNSIDC
jgi:hypothetical protein